ncbi:MAG TPA: efflux RND transporter periplasmic adaptor subunit [Steroidobacteraceae bacterium]|nr:efflux RND transporter periplasmic adaptor subunit [Steroidobacteraceae bacterium]
MTTALVASLLAGHGHSAGCRRRRVLAFTALLLPTLLLGCGGHAGGAAGPQAVSVVDVTPRDTPFSYEYVGQTQSSHQVQILARVNGFLDRRVYAEGSMVKAGQTMYLQDPKPFQAKLDAAKAGLEAEQARLQVQRDNLVRVKPLAARNALSQKDLTDAIGAEKEASAAVDAARARVEEAQLNLSYTMITTPVSGASSYSRVQEGQYLDANKAAQLTYVAQLDPIWVNFSISENDLLKIRTEASQGALRLPPKDDFEVQVVLSDGSLFPSKGRITFANADYNQETGTFLLRATLGNPDGVLRPGQFVRVRVSGAVRPNAVLVPQQAVLEGAQGKFVILVDKEQRAQVRPVQVGPWLGQNWFITSGLAKGDMVVTDGMARLTPGAAVKIANTQTTDGSRLAEAPPAEGGSAAAPPRQ